MCDLVLEQLAEAQAQAAQLTRDGQVSDRGSGLGQPPRQPTAVSPTYAYGPCVVWDWGALRGVLRGAQGNLSACPGAAQPSDGVEEFEPGGGMLVLYEQQLHA